MNQVATQITNAVLKCYGLTLGDIVAKLGRRTHHRQCRSILAHMLRHEAGCTYQEIAALLQRDNSSVQGLVQRLSLKLFDGECEDSQHYRKCLKRLKEVGLCSG